MKNNTIPHHSFNELMGLLGESPPANGLHIIEQQEPLNNFPIDHPYQSDHFALIILTAGKARIRINLTEYNMRKNSVLTISPHAIRQILETSPDCLFAGTAFTTGYLAGAGMNLKHVDMLDFFSSNNQHPCFQLEEQDADRLLGLLHFLAQKQVIKNPAPADLEALHYSFLAWIYEFSSVQQRYHGAHNKIRVTRKEDLTMRFSRLLADHFKEERSVLFYAQRLFVSPKYLSRTVKEITNRTAGEWIDEMVIMNAKILLNNLSLSIAQVAESLDFSDQFFFSKYFKKHTGITPSEYRKSR